MIRKGIALIVMLLVISLSITPSIGNIIEESGISLIVIKAFEEKGDNDYCISDVPIIISSESDDIDEIYYRIDGGSWIEYRASTKSSD